MSLNIETASARVARSLNDYEKKLNAALQAGADFQSDILAARQVDGFSPFDGQESLLRLGRSQDALNKAMSQMARVHRDMRETYARAHDIDITAGPEEECPRRCTTGLHEEQAGAVRAA